MEPIPITSGCQEHPGKQLDNLALNFVHLLKVAHILALQHQVHNAAGASSSLEQAAAVYRMAEPDLKTRMNEQGKLEQRFASITGGPNHAAGKDVGFGASQ
ncbi:MAG: hypothetical protein ACLTMA_06180 [Gemmiger formicilis]|uniref:hypothetical protein n=1 Tax=Gemmiger formicilis TaxID=745368 RepID=UPI003A4B34A1